jgi:hypothetical protein
MPLHESYTSRDRRDRWPLQFDLEGVPRETAERERLLNHQRMEGEMGKTSPVANSFAVDYQAGNNVIDINHPPRMPYVFQEYPKMMYAPNGKSVVVNGEAEEKRYAKMNYALQPPAKKADEVQAV